MLSARLDRNALGIGNLDQVTDLQWLPYPAALAGPFRYEVANRFHGRLQVFGASFMRETTHLPYR